jgi:ATP-dependent exoDNAse (exonuclease V) beta subunit
MGIPATAADQPGLLATPEAVLLLACLRRLHDANDTLATAEIISLADCAKPETWVSDRLSYLQSGLKGANWLEVSEAMGPAHPILKRLAQIRMEVGNLAPAEILQRIVSQCDLTERVLRWQTDIDLARLRLANLEALIACAEEYEQACLSISSPTSL